MYGKSIIFLRVGAFYTVFNDDAYLVAEKLGLPVRETCSCNSDICCIVSVSPDLYLDV